MDAFTPSPPTTNVLTQFFITLTYDIHSLCLFYLEWSPAITGLFKTTLFISLANSPLIPPFPTSYLSRFSFRFSFILGGSTRDLL
jgi:hypothetical protein